MDFFAAYMVMLCQEKYWKPILIPNQWRKKWEELRR